MDTINKHHFTSVRFQRYKGFQNFSISLRQFNILVGPNNCGKSTILAAFRILSEGIRKASSRNPTIVQGPQGETRGYILDLKEIPVAMENVFYDYDDSEPASIRFGISNGNELILFFPDSGRCFLICETSAKPVTSTLSFKLQFPVSVGFVPTLGPVEHEETLYQKEAARLALFTHRASRNFRNIWFHYPDEFKAFQGLIKTTWPGMDIEKPEIDRTHEKPLLRMFCPEERIPREIFWVGFGFQVWCQMLTYIIRGRESSIFLIDEPDIYLHADLQRQLLNILKTLGPDILIATHSTEIISEADSDDLLVVNKKNNSAKRIKDPSQLQYIFHVLGSNLNPVLTQLAKTRRALFLEGRDFQILSRFARKLLKPLVADRSDFAVVPVEGFNPARVRNFIEGIETTLGNKILSAVIFDRDYRSDAECKKELAIMNKFTLFAHIHMRKELENFLLVPNVLERTIRRKIEQYNLRTKKKLKFGHNVNKMLIEIIDPIRPRTLAKYLARRRVFEKSINRGFDDSTIDENIVKEFENLWSDLNGRLLLVPGKLILSNVNKFLQIEYGITISASLIIDSFHKDEIPEEMTRLIEQIDNFRRQIPE